MYVHARARLVYLAHPRTASQATAAALEGIGFEKPTPGDHHMRLWDYAEQDIVTELNRHEWTVFTTVRNHFDALVSWVCKRYKNRSGPVRWELQSFETALFANAWVEQHRLWGRHSGDADVIMRYERLETDLANILLRKGLLVPRLPKKNVSEERRGRHYREFYTDETKGYVEERFRDELKQFDYHF